MHAIAGPNLRDDRGELGNGLLTRRPTAHHQLIDLSVSALEPRGAIDACLEIEGSKLRVLVTHLGLSRGERAIQTGALRDRIAHGPTCDATVLVGDLNEWRPRLIRPPELGSDLFPTRIRPRTFPSRLPVLRLDRVLVAPQPLRISSRVVRTRLARTASDHLPVVVELEWANG
jgi:endonuclease/exonuclease/phosphatase family metal-dependent hydrolase